MDHAEYKALMERMRGLVEEELARIENTEAASIYPELRRAMFYSLEAGGKRLRPCLMLAVCEMLGGEVSRALPFACALEMIHTYSLIHDDLPCMDDDDMRRGRPSNHKVFGEAMAVLAGDGLLSFAFETLLKAVAAHPDEGALKAANEIACRAGASGMVTGQAADIEFEGSAVQTEQMLMFIHRHKTADMLTAAVLCGAYIAGADENTVSALREYSEKMGLLFQITDDILDMTGDPALVGKTLGKDKESGKLTYAVLYGLEGAKARAEQAAEEAKAAICGVKNAERLAAAVDEMLTRSK